jgi:hypothetical protein
VPSWLVEMEVVRVAVELVAPVIEATIATKSE